MQILHPVTFLVGINSLFSLCTTVIPPFLGTICTGLIHELSEIGYIIPASNNFTISFFTTSFIFGFSLLYLSAIGLCPSSICSLCMTIEGLMPFMSEICHPNALTRPLTTSHTSSQGADAGTAEGSTLEELTTSLQASTIAFDGKEKPLLFWFTFESKNPFDVLREKTPPRESSPEEGEGYVKRS